MSNALTLHGQCVDVMEERLAILRQPTDTNLLKLNPDIALVAGHVQPVKWADPKTRFILQSGLDPSIMNLWLKQVAVEDLSDGYVSIDLP